MTASYRKNEQGKPRKGTLARTRRHARPPAPGVNAKRPARQNTRPVSTDPRVTRCEILARRTVILGAFSVLRGCLKPFSWGESARQVRFDMVIISCGRKFLKN